MTDNSIKVFTYLVEHRGDNLTAADIASTLGITINAVTGSINGFVKKGLAIREEVMYDHPTEGKKIKKILRVTEAGLRYYIKIWEEDMRLFDVNNDTPTFSSITEDKDVQYSISYNKCEKFFDGKTNSAKFIDTEYMTTLPTLATCMAQANVLRGQKDIGNICIYMYDLRTGSKQLVMEVDSIRDVATLPKPSQPTPIANHSHSIPQTIQYETRGNGASTYIACTQIAEPKESKLKMQLANCEEKLALCQAELKRVERKFQNAVPVDFAEKALQEAVIETMQGTAASVMEMFDDGWDIETIYKILGEIAQGKYEPPTYINNRQRLFPPSEEAIQDKLNTPK